MDYDSETSVQNGRKKRGETLDKPDQSHQKTCKSDGVSRSWHLINAAAAVSGTATQAKASLGATANRSLTAQVMEYYQKYSQNSNLNQYFSLPTTTSNTIDNAKHYYSIYEVNPKHVPTRQSSIGEDYTLKSCIPKERRRWIRPPLVGQSSTEAPSIYVRRSMTDSALVDPIVEQQEPASPSQQEQQPTIGASTASSSSAGSEGVALIAKEHSNETAEGPLQESAASEASVAERKATSPTSSVASHKPLEWDSGADVGYLAGAPPPSSTAHRLSTLERMALARGCSAALRLDPEGTTEHQQQQSPGSRAGASPQALPGKPEASSTPLLLQPPSVSGSESEIEITPIVKSHLPGLLVGEDAACGNSSSTPICRKELLKNVKDSDDTPKNTGSILKRPIPLKYPLEDTNLRLKGAGDNQLSSISKESNSDSNSLEGSPLKKSTSMNLLISSAAQLPLRRSQSDLNLCGNDKPAPRLIFNSTSSIATVVNKPSTCNKLIQTSMKVCKQESVGVQVSVPKIEEKPPLPKRATSLGPKNLNSILKNSKSTYRVQNPKTPCANRMMTDENIQVDIEKKVDSSSDYSQNASLTPLADDTENITGRANSFEYFPGHIYENVPNGSTSHVSSVDTGATHSTMPNTSSSIDEKLWGDSDNLVRDLERSVHILKSLVDANKLDKHVKKRLIHHVVKRLVTAKYTDDKIEHNLEENVPWNPADARNKVYRTEIIQALAKNTTDSSDDWKPSQKKKNPKKSTACNEARTMKEIINAAGKNTEIESSTTDKFDRNTDRTVMDGRKARMGLRVDDCGRRSSTNTPTNKSESSECFVPQHIYSKKSEIKKVLTTSTSNTSTQDQNRALLDAVVNNRRSPMDSSNEADNCADWRMPTTVSERRYEMRRCSNSESGDSKLVSYAEMEKRNQLVWITNEISHLSNLKKLLEQPKTKSERHSKASPRKSKQAPCNLKPTKPLPLTHVSQQQNGEMTCEDSQWDRQWSSHCNLASTSMQTDSNAVKRLKKRNSCTQTATNDSAAYSRSGSEIVSARICSPKTKWANACIQTPKVEASTEVRASVQQCQKCHGLPHSRTVVSTTCGGSGQVCGQICCCIHDNSKLQHCYTCSNDKQGTHQQAKFAHPSSEGTKEVKNHLNTTKMKCVCENNKKQVLEVQKELPSGSQTAKDYYCDGEYSSAQYRISESSVCQCIRECDCKNKKLVCGFSRLQINVPSKDNQFDKVNSKTCSCKHNGQMERNCNQINAVPQSCHLSTSNNPNPQTCCCRNKTKDQSPTNSNTRYNVGTRETISNNSKYCRVCGAVYQNERKCGCVPKSYPKPVAYELSFVNSEVTDDNSEASQCSKVNIEVKKLERNYNASSTRSHSKSKSSVGTCSCGASQSTVKHYDCNHEKEKPKKTRKEKASLQEYLILNNPGFADNVETRRQYVSEIQRLRQLRKDKRVHLLAMAPTTNIFKSSRPTPVAKCKPRKISDKEMRERLRKRYSQLSEVREKRKQQQLQEEARCNKLMAKIFCKKLQQKVLRGQVDLSQSASVISNL